MCYESLLGLKGCDTPETGLYIDDLSINSAFLDNIITGQYQVGSDLFEDKRKMAWRKLSSDVLSRLQPSMKADTIIENKRIGHTLTNSTNIDAALGAGNYGGVRISIDYNNTSFLNLVVTDFNIAITAANTVVLVFDMITRQKVGEFTYTVGSIDQYVNREYKAKRRKLDLAFVYESVEATYKIVPKYGSCTDCGGNITEAVICPFVKAIGIELTTDGTTVTTFANKPYTQGVSIVYNVNCDRESWLCSIGGLMALPLAYATAVEIYDYALTVSPNQRVNTIVSINMETVKQGRDIVAQKYNDELTAILTNMRLPSDRHCFDCNSRSKMVSILS